MDRYSQYSLNRIEDSYKFFMYQFKQKLVTNIELVLPLMLCLFIYSLGYPLAVP